jgi:hypothetical protein
VTGYLQRLAAGAARSAGAIHPVLRPLYSNPLTDVGIEPPQLQADAPMSATAAQPSDPRIRPEQVRLVQLPAGPATPPLAPRRNGQSSPPHVPHQTTPAPQTPFNATVPNPRPGPEARTDDGHAARTVSTALPIDERVPRTPRRPGYHPRAASSEASFVPLVAAPAYPENPTNFTAEMLPPSPVVAAINDRRPVHPHRPRAAEPGDVEIHIGRIEVTAVNPAPAAPPPKPPRRAPSLDEYLKRRRRSVS